MKTEFTQIENEMINFNFDELNLHLEKAKLNFVGAKNASDVKTEICKVWSRIRKYVKLAENIPFIGKFIVILSDLLDTLCES